MLMRFLNFPPSRNKFFFTPPPKKIFDTAMRGHLPFSVQFNLEKQSLILNAKCSLTKAENYHPISVRPYWTLNPNIFLQMKVVYGWREFPSPYMLMWETGLWRIRNVYEDALFCQNCTLSKILCLVNYKRRYPYKWALITTLQINNLLWCYRDISPLTQIISTKIIQMKGHVTFPNVWRIQKTTTLLKTYLAWDFFLENYSCIIYGPLYINKKTDKILLRHL